MTLILPADAAVKTAQKFIDLCYKFQEFYPDSSEIGKRLRTLARDSKHFLVLFQPCRIFVLDKKIVFGLLGTVTTNFIVAVEFNENELSGY